MERFSAEFSTQFDKKYTKHGSKFNLRPCAKKGPSLHQLSTKTSLFDSINLLNAELNPICYLLGLLGGHHFLHVSRI